MLIDLAKRAAPVLIGLYGARLLVSKLGPKIPGVSALGTFQGPALAIGTVLLTSYATKKVGALAKYRSEILLGTGLAALDALISAFAPASVKSMIGVGDVYDRALGEYVQMGEYIENVAGARPVNDGMGEYVQLTGAEEELGLDEELGLEEELGLGDQGSYGEGVTHQDNLHAIPSQPYLTPVPQRSYVKPIGPASTMQDNPRSYYTGIFAGGAGGC